MEMGGGVRLLQNINNNRRDGRGENKIGGIAQRTFYFNCKLKFPIMDSDISSHQNPSF